MTSQRRSNQVHERRTAGSRRQANSSVAARRLYRYAHAGPGKLPVTERAAADPGEQQRRSRRNRTATASARLTSVRLPQSGNRTPLKGVTV